MEKTKKIFDSHKIFCLAIVLLLFASCKREFGIYRFIDHLDEKNVIFSPLMNFEQKFEKIEQEWQGKHMSRFDLAKKKYWAIVMEKPVLDLDGSQVPKGMKIFHDGQEMESGWELRRIERKINPATYTKYKKEFNSVVLSKDIYFVSNNFRLPQGKILIEVKARSRKVQEYSPLLKIFLNEKLIGEVPVGRSQIYTLICNASLGRNKLRLGFSEVIERSPHRGTEELLLDEIKIQCLTDMILFSPTEQGEMDLPDGSFRAAYYVQPASEVLIPADPGTAQKGLSSGFTLESEDSIERNIDLDSGLNLLEMVCYSKPKGSILSVWLDNKKIGQQWIYAWTWRSYVFELLAEKGEHILKIQWHKPKAAEDSHPESYLVINQMAVKSPLQNITSPLLEVLRAANKYPLEDLGRGENPNSIKNKFMIGEYSINALFAPPKSEFSFELKIPKSAVLEFGCGILPRTADATGDGVKFEIAVENEILFSRTMNSADKKESQLFVKGELELSAYQGKEVKIDFITDENSNALNDLSFWYNPVIYPKREEGAEKSEENINIILISLDSLRADHLGCFGYERETSPNIDLLADDSVLFTNCFSQAPYTISSHMSMLTSLFPINHGVYSVDYKLDPSILTLADVLRSNNYFTGAFTGGGQVSSAFGFSKGFDFYHEIKKGVFQGENIPNFSNLILEWLNDNTEKDFFLFLHTYQIHDPYSPPEPFNQKFKSENAKWNSVFMFDLLDGRTGRFKALSEEERDNVIALYDGEIRYTDEYFIKALVEELKKLDLYDRTMIIVTSDHGDEFYDHGSWIHGHTLYNELIKIPLIIKFPFSKYKGRKIENIIRAVDIMPTALEETGVNFSDFKFDGQSLIKVIKHKEKGDRIFFSEIKGFRYIPAKTATNQNGFKVILNTEYTEIQSQYYTPPPPHQKELELFDLGKDPLEKNNVAESEIQISRELLDRILRYLQQEGKGREKDKKSIIDEELQQRLKALGYIR